MTLSTVMFFALLTALEPNPLSGIAAAVALGAVAAVGRRYKYELRNAKGDICCASDYPDFPRCGKCSAAVAAPPAQPRTAVAPALEKRTLADWRQYIADTVSPRLEAPDAYRTARLAAPREPEPTDDPAYQPYGVPPNPYELALASRKLAKETR